jgi:hypothetical protein
MGQKDIDQQGQTGIIPKRTRGTVKRNWQTGREVEITAVSERKRKRCFLGPGKRTESLYF